MSRHVREPQPGEWPVTGPLADLFAAATRAPEPDELAGEDAAVAAFRAHRTHPGRPTARAPLATGVRWLTIKAVGLCVGALAAGGVAVAATTGALPAPPTHHAPPATRSTGAPSSSRPPARPTPHASSAVAPAAVVQLCWVFLRVPPQARHELLDHSREYEALIAAAGGRNRVEGYCDRLVAASPLPGVPNGIPTSAPTGYPTGLPTGVPTPPPLPVRPPVVIPRP